MTDIGLTHIALPVRSLKESVAFYGTYANMQVVHSRPGVVWVSDRTRPFAIVLLETSSEIHPLLPMAHLGVGVSSRAEVDRLCELAFRTNALHARQSRWIGRSATGPSFVTLMGTRLRLPMAKILSGFSRARPNNSFKPNPLRGNAWVLFRYASTQSPPRCGSA